MNTSAVCIPYRFIVDAQCNKNQQSKAVKCDALSYSFDAEHRLTQMIRLKDSSGAQKTLNELLRVIVFSSDENMLKIKCRVYELLVIMSRAAIEGGGNIETVFKFNERFANELADKNDMLSIKKMIHTALEKYISHVLTHAPTNNQGVIQQITEYIGTELPRKISIEEVANHVFLSTAYLGRMIRRELGVTFKEYVNGMRVEQSKVLLKESQMPMWEISKRVGFCDQSYFTKIFKRSEGVSPNKYREKSVHRQVAAAHSSCAHRNA